MAKFISNLVSRGSSFLKLETGNFHSVRHLRGRAPEEARNLKQRLEEIEKLERDPELFFKVNIGLPRLKPSRSQEYSERMAILKEVRENPEKLKASISLETVRKEWLTTAGPFHLKRIAEHYNIFQDLFGDAYFVPRIPLTIKYQDLDETLTPVFSGNHIKPSEAKNQPTVTYEADPSSLWTLLLTNPDGHFSEKDAEYVHWFIGNIPGNDIAQGEVVVDYLQPFPCRGIGSQRMIFILYKQENKIDFSCWKRQLPCLKLPERSFRTQDFYRTMQDSITPAGLAFFQSDWDRSVTGFFHNTLDMKEPVYEFDFPTPYKKPPVWFPKKEPFNLYLDKHRDPKQIAKELLLKRLKTVHPFGPYPKEPRFPNAFPEDNKLPSWLRVEIRKQRLKWGRYSDM